MKGVILAGGTGSRLHPLTQITNKHLLPIYDRPMISYGIEALVKAVCAKYQLQRRTGDVTRKREDDPQRLVWPIDESAGQIPKIRQIR